MYRQCVPPFGNFAIAQSHDAEVLPQIRSLGRTIEIIEVRYRKNARKFGNQFQAWITPPLLVAFDQGPGAGSRRFGAPLCLMLINTPAEFA